MNHEQWLALLGPVLAALILPLATLAGMVVTGIAGQIKGALAARGLAANAEIVDKASSQIQAAMQNAAGTLVVRAQAGQLDLTNLQAVKAEAAVEARAIEAKLPGAVAVLAPLAGAVAAGVVGKLGALLAPSAIPVVDR